MTPTTSRSEPLILEDFSSEYLLVHGVDVLSGTANRAEMDWALLELLEQTMGGEVVGRLGTVHYEFEASFNIPSKTVAVPEDGIEDNQLLLLK